MKLLLLFLLVRYVSKKLMSKKTELQKMAEFRINYAKKELDKLKIKAPKRKFHFATKVAIAYFILMHLSWIPRN